MGGGLMQLVAHGAQDSYLTGNPQITFFKVVYRRHTNFSIESIEQTLNGSTFSGGTQVCNILRNGDLIKNCYISVSSATYGLKEGQAYDLIDYVDFEIGGSLIDRQHGDWNAIWWELTTPESKVNCLRNMLIETSGSVDGKNNVSPCYYPLNFWFCRNPGLALPLIALQYHEVKLNITWGVVPDNSSALVWIDYIYLDNDERRRFAQTAHEYLIEQVQRESYQANVNNVKLPFNHPIKELIWVNAGASVPYNAGNQFAPLGNAGATTNNSSYTPGDGDDEISIKLSLNGHDRFAEREAKYFKIIQPYQYHTRIPAPQKKEATISISGTSANEPFFIVSKTSRILSIKLNTSTGIAAGTTTKINHGTVTSGLLVTNNNLTDDIALNNATTTPNTLSKLDFNCIVKSNDGIALSVAVAAAESISIKIEYEELPTLIAGDNANTANIYCYSFGLNPEEHQPSGTCNFSRIDTAQIKSIGGNFGSIASYLKVFALNYNVLRIMSGMGGLAYSN